MNRFFTVFISLSFMFSLFGKDTFDNSFITKYEYGKMLYENPRGISCNKCHGDDAKGKTIARFEHTFNKKKHMCEIRSNDITNLSYENFQRYLDPKLEKPKKKFSKNQKCEKLTYGNSMPTYFLTDEELEAIYFYLTNIGEKNYE